MNRVKETCGGSYVAPRHMRRGKKFAQRAVGRPPGGGLGGGSKKAPPGGEGASVRSFKNHEMCRAFFAKDLWGKKGRPPPEKRGGEGGVH